MTTTYNEAEALAICARLEAEPSLGLREILRQAGVPKSTFHGWRKDHPVLEEAYQAAKLDGYDSLAQECLVIADTPAMGVTEKYEPVEIANPSDPEMPPVTEFQLTERKVEDMLGHRKLQIETRQKLLSKWYPKKYGDKLALAGDNDSPLTVVVRRFSGE